MTQPPPLAALLTASQLNATHHLGGWALVVIGALIWLLWPIIAIRHWQNVVESHARLGYFIGDMAIVAPLCFASGYGSIEDYRWGLPMLLLAVGASAYDLTHFLVFLAQIGVPQIRGKRLPVAVYAVAIVLVLVVLGYIAWRAIRVIITPPTVALATFAPQGGGLYVAIATVLAGLLVSALVIWRCRRAAPLPSLPPGA